ncbi:MAG TPA: hypothetical protein VLO11_07870 [Luteolibacter sp.]|nr:hypothetical protein [Luteolibacter sp.]
MKNKLLLLLMALPFLALGACQKKTPAEKAADNMEDAAEEVGEAVENAGDAVKDAAE